MNEEAINTLKVILEEATETEYSISYVTSGDADALKAAIQALEQQSCDSECIEKNEPIRRIEVRRNITVDGEDEDDKWIRGYNEGIDDAIACIKSVPPVTPKGVTVTDFADRCRECGKDIKQIYISKILDKIRAEIANHCGLAKEDRCKYCYWCNNVMGVKEILKVIDKYRSESEVEE